MNCQGCGYRLWNLPPGDCPECGRAFKPSDFEFRPNAVQYVCPHCEQVYYGIDPQGHLVPRAFACVSCSAALEMDRMLVRPDRAVEEDQTAKARNPWVDRRVHGFVMGWLRAVGQSLVLPHRLIASTPPDTTGDAVSFFVVTLFAYVAVSALPWALFMGVIGAASGNVGDLFGFLGVVGGFFLMAFAFGALFLAVQTCVTHVVLLLRGPLEHGWTRTLQCLCYGGAGMVLVVVPCFGFHLLPFALGWWCVSSILMLMRGQGVSGLRASVAVLAVPMVLGVAAVAGVVYVAQQMSVQAQALQQATQPQTDALAAALSGYAAANQGQGPRHASELLVGGYATPEQFVEPFNSAQAYQVPVGSSTLGAYWSATGAEKAQFAAEAAAALPPDVVAHRVGDHVFTYHGIALDPPPDPGLWVVVRSPVGNSPMVPLAGDLIVATSDGTSVTVPAAAFAAELAAQNALRVSLGLPPLPDPATVTHEHAATAPLPESP